MKTTAGGHHSTVQRHCFKCRVNDRSTHWRLDRAELNLSKVLGGWRPGACLRQATFRMKTGYRRRAVTDFHRLSSDDSKPASFGSKTADSLLIFEPLSTARRSRTSWNQANQACNQAQADQHGNCGTDSIQWRSGQAARPSLATESARWQFLLRRSLITGAATMLTVEYGIPSHVS